MISGTLKGQRVLLHNTGHNKIQTNIENCTRQDCFRALFNMSEDNTSSP